MAKAHFKSVDEYVAAQSGPVKKVLRQVRSTIRKALPEAEEVISYNIPAYKLHDKLDHKNCEIPGKRINHKGH